MTNDERVESDLDFGFMFRLLLAKVAQNSENADARVLPAQISFREERLGLANRSINYFRYEPIHIEHPIARLIRRERG